MNDKVSIIIPFYNTKLEYFAKCMSSVLSQTYKNFEVIIVNDGSDEKYCKFIDKFKSFNNVHILNQENKGVSAARNKGIDYANGQWCIFVDADDWLQKDCLSNFIKISNNLNVDYIVSKINIVEGNSARENINKYDSSCYVNKNILINSILNSQDTILSCADTPWAKFFNLEFLRSNNLHFNEKLKNGEDVIFNFECAINSDRVYYLNTPTYNYNCNDFSECRTNTNLETKTTTFINILREKFDQYNIKNESLLDNYVLRLVNRLLRKHYMKYDEFKDFQKDFENLLNKPEYSLTFNKKDIVIFNDRNKKVFDMSKNKKFNDIINLLKNKHITK